MVWAFWYSRGRDVPLRNIPLRTCNVFSGHVSFTTTGSLCTVCFSLSLSLFELVQILQVKVSFNKWRPSRRDRSLRPIQEGTSSDTICQFSRHEHVA